MAKNDFTLTAARLRELLDYNPETGVFTRKIATSNAKVGDKSGCVRSDGHTLCRVDNRLYLAHRLAWLYVYGELPVNAIWHIDGRKDNNCIGNLTDTAKVNEPITMTHKLLLANISYDPMTGIFTRISNGQKKATKGSKHGDGYLCISVFGKDYRAHRLAWFYVHGEFPVNQIDHINGIRSDNRLSNLREATPSENSMNRHSPKGVVRQNKKWGAKIKSKPGCQTWLGTFDTYELAREAYLTAKRIHHPTCTI